MNYAKSKKRQVYMSGKELKFRALIAVAISEVNLSSTDCSAVYYSLLALSAQNQFSVHS